MNHEGEKFEFHAIVMVGMRYTDDDEESEEGVEDPEPSEKKALEVLKQVAEEGSGDGVELDENNKGYVVMFNWGDKWGQEDLALWRKN
ncbi:hypothetical protein ACFX16_029177 [Malus domestica]